MTFVPPKRVSIVLRIAVVVASGLSGLESAAHSGGRTAARTAARAARTAIIRLACITELRKDAAGEPGGWGTRCPTAEYRRAALSSALPVPPVLSESRLEG